MNKKNITSPAFIYWLKRNINVIEDAFQTKLSEEQIMWFYGAFQVGRGTKDQLILNPVPPIKGHQVFSLGGLFP